MACVAVLTSTDCKGLEMSASLRSAITSLGHDGFVLSGVPSSRFSPLPQIPMHGLDDLSIAQLCRERGANLIVPVAEGFTRLAASIGERLGLRGPSERAVRTLADKSEFFSKLQEIGVPSCETIVPTRPEDLSIEWDGPVFVKPTLGTGSRKTAPFDYRMFESLDDFNRFLLATNSATLLFEENTSEQPLGKHMVCRYIDAPQTFNIAIATFDGVNTPLLNMLMTYFDDDDHQGSAVACRHTAPVDSRIRQELNIVIERLQRATGLDNTLWGLEYAIDSCEQLRLIEAHTRLPQSQSLFVARMFREFWRNALNAWSGREHEFAQTLPQCIRQTIPLAAGRIKRIRLPPTDANGFLHFTDTLRPGFVVPRVLRRPEYEPAFCAVGTDLSELKTQAADYVRQIEVEYESC